MQQAYLVGLADYPNHRLAGVPNDLALMRRALLHQGFAADAIHTVGDEAGALVDLYRVLTTIRADFADANGPTHHCFFYFSGSGVLSVDPLQGGIKPLDGDDLDFGTALPFAALNDYLPGRSGVQVTVVLDC